MRSSPHTVTYKDLVSYMTKKLGCERQRETAARSSGTSSMDPITHDKACAEKLLRMLKKCEPGKQADLFEKFKETR